MSEQYFKAKLCLLKPWTQITVLNQSKIFIGSLAFRLHRGQDSYFIPVFRASFSLLIQRWLNLEPVDSHASSTDQSAWRELKACFCSVHSRQLRKNLANQEPLANKAISSFQVFVSRSRTVQERCTSE